MKIVIAITLIIFALFGLLFPLFYYRLQIRNENKQLKESISTNLFEFTIERIYRYLAYLAILSGAIGLLLNTSWSTTICQLGLAMILLYVWFEQLGSIYMFWQIKNGKGNAYKELLQQEATKQNQLLGFEELLGEITLEEEDYEEMIREELPKELLKLVVKSVLLIPVIIYLHNLSI